MLPADIAKKARSAFPALGSSLILLVVNDLPDDNKVRITMEELFRPTSGVGDHTCHQEWEGTACMYQPWSLPAGYRGYA